MKSLHFDHVGKQLPAHQSPAGVAGFASWRRLSEIFRKAGEIRDFERIIGWQIDERGITFKVEITT